MSLPFRSRTIPQCSACIRSYAFAAFDELHIANTGIGQQVRRSSKKKAIVATTVPVRLLKGVKSFGRKGAIVPVSFGRMRNEWFPRRIAEYMTLPEQRALRLKNTTFERDFQYGAEEDLPTLTSTSAQSLASTVGIPTQPFIRRTPELERLSPERSMQLIEIFVPQRLDFYRQPIPAEPEPAAPKRATPSIGTGIAAELFAARAQAEEASKPVKPAAAQAIYGSVSTQNVLDAVKAALATNDESARVGLVEEDVRFIAGPEVVGVEEAGRVVKHVGDFTVEIRVRGGEEGVKRHVRVNAQEV
ncbi:hypothetical protein B0A48_04051 [Cryoendolithus antarcticus]|uniref:Ribosomal protein L9 domain-containing protein n=1 Tax=Cryoendolithus antarcticus TaxID=1507870 RepID=A0A1V8THM9_9PEZI|nr:hypothetical protein B0A48_04051 [Cryoendolithus antarcticus]